MYQMCPITSNHQLLRDSEDAEDNRHKEYDKSLVLSSLQDVVDLARPPPSPPPSQPPCEDDSDPLMDDVSIQISEEFFNFCDDSDIFSDTLQNDTLHTSEVTSTPKCCTYENHFQGGDQNGSTTSSTTTTATTVPTSNHLRHHHNNNLSTIYDPQLVFDTDISASIDFSTTPQHAPLPYNLNYPTTFLDLSQYATSPVDPTVSSLPLNMVPPLGLSTVFEDDCLPLIPSYLRTSISSSSSSCTYMDPISTFGSFPNGLCNDNSGLFGRNLLMSSDLQAKEVDYQGDNGGIFCNDQLGRYNSGDFQAFSNDNSQIMMNGATSSGPISTEISSLDDSTYKVGKLSVEQRKEKIHRYMKKRNERNFSKKIKYACRKTLADSRPRVRGRFAKNDEFGEGHHKHFNGHNEDDDYDDVAVKEEDDMMNSSEIYAHISGVNSFKFNYQIQSWI